MYKFFIIFLKKKVKNKNKINDPVCNESISASNEPAIGVKREEILKFRSATIVIDSNKENKQIPLNLMSLYLIEKLYDYNLNNNDNQQLVISIFDISNYYKKVNIV